MKLRVKMNLVQKVKYSYPEFILDTADYPEIEGKTLDEIRDYIERHGRSMHAVDGGSSNLLDELRVDADRFVIKDYPGESHFYVNAEDEEVDINEFYK